MALFKQLMFPDTPTTARSVCVSVPDAQQAIEIAMSTPPLGQGEEQHDAHIRSGHSTNDTRRREPNPPRPSSDRKGHHKRMLTLARSIDDMVKQVSTEVREKKEARDKREAEHAARNEKMRREQLDRFAALNERVAEMQRKSQDAVAAKQSLVSRSETDSIDDILSNYGESEQEEEKPSRGKGKARDTQDVARNRSVDQKISTHNKTKPSGSPLLKPRSETSQPIDIPIPIRVQLPPSSLPLPRFTPPPHPPPNKPLPPLPSKPSPKLAQTGPPKRQSHLPKASVVVGDATKVVRHKHSESSLGTTEDPSNAPRKRKGPPKKTVMFAPPPPREAFGRSRSGDVSAGDDKRGGRSARSHSKKAAASPETEEEREESAKPKRPHR